MRGRLWMLPSSSTQDEQAAAPLETLQSDDLVAATGHRVSRNVETEARQLIRQDRADAVDAFLAIGAAVDVHQTL